MKTLFGIILAVLILAAFFTWRSLPGEQSDVPILYWVTDPNPARVEQIRTFRQWLKKNNYPDIEVRVDTVNTSSEKILVQGVSGVCGDLLDHTGGANMRFRQAVGLLEDITVPALEMGFDLSKTYASLKDELSIDGRQYGFPCNLSSDALWVNLEAFESVGMDAPPRRWTIENFERIGREFVERKRRETPGTLQRYFFVTAVDVMVLARTMGGAIYNETQSACVIDSEPYRRALGLRYKWTYEDHLIPTASERGTFSAGAGYGGSNFALFSQGYFALCASGRWALIQFRRFSDDRREAGREPLKLGVSEWPYGSFPCSAAYTRATAVYAGGKNKEYAKYFMAYLTSEEYNMNIVNDADGLPPNPVYTKTEEYRKPKDRPEEWGVHEAFADIMEDLGVSPEFSPFVLDSVASRFINETTDKYMNDKMSLAEATANMQRLVNEEIQRSLKEEPAKKPLYEERLTLQQKINGLRAEGKKVPLSWITNPYWRKWYTHHNLADEDL